MQWDKNWFQKHYNKNVDSLRAFVLQKKLCTSHTIRKECIKGAETLTGVRWLQTDTFKAKTKTKKQKKRGGDRIIKLKFRTKSFHCLFLITQKPTNKINVSYRVSGRILSNFRGSYFLTRNHSTYSACASLSSFFTYTLHTRTDYRCLVQGASNMTGTICV